MSEITLEELDAAHTAACKAYTEAPSYKAMDAIYDAKNALARYFEDAGD